jgi:hypothetical protein
MGGVPKAIRFDNLSPAVKKVLPNAEWQLTEEFQNFVLHYGFECSGTWGDWQVFNLCTHELKCRTLHFSAVKVCTFILQNYL